MLVLTLPMTIVAVLLGIIICLAKREKALRARLNSMADLT
jgi:type III secretory pathway component EscS